MDLTLRRLDKSEDGIFGELTGESFILDTLEHSYDSKPKLPQGVYTCERSMHRLHGMTQDFETFEIMNVPGHSGVLFHWGNYNKDSEGCVLLGVDRQGNMITNSKIAFAKFMKAQEGLDSFQLTVLP